MKTRQKLEIIRRRLSLTQTQLASKLGVSFVAFNHWWTGQAIPRPKKRAAIEELYLEVTGQKIIPAEYLQAKKRSLRQQSSEHQNLVSEILQNPDLRDQLTLKLTYHSNSIEGSTLTEQDTAAILFDNVALPHKSLTEHLEAKNHQTAFNYLLDHLSRAGPINETLVLKLHAILMNGVRQDAGSYRRHAVRITGVNLPTANYLKIPELISEVMIQAQEKTDDIITASAGVHSRFERLHPFSDGNGRIGRLFMNAMLLNAQFAPAVIRQEQKQLYYTYLYKAQTQGDQSQLESFLCEAVAEGFKILERRDME